MPDNELVVAAVKDIHCLYCQLTGRQLTLRYDRERLWFEFLRAGFVPEELRRVVRYPKRKSVPVVATSARSNSPRTFFNSTASKKTSTLAG